MDHLFEIILGMAMLHWNKPYCPSIFLQSILHIGSMLNSQGDSPLQVEHLRHSYWHGWCVCFSIRVALVLVVSLVLMELLVARWVRESARWDPNRVGRKSVKLCFQLSESQRHSSLSITNSPMSWLFFTCLTGCPWWAWCPWRRGSSGSHWWVWKPRCSWRTWIQGGFCNRFL